jgi:hypothetical protein
VVTKVIRPFILFTEADKKSDAPDMDTNPAADAEVTAPIHTPEEPMPTDDEDNPDGDPSSEDDTGGDDTTGDGDTGGDDDNTDDTDSTPAVDFTDALKKERMFDAVVEIRKQCDILTPSVAFLSTSIKDDKVITVVIKLKKIIQDTSDQCDMICAKFADIGYDNIVKLYPVLADRISTVSDILENVLDSDERFKAPENK